MIGQIKNFIKKNYFRRKFKIHNKKVFNNEKIKKKNIILIELNQWAYLHIIKSYLANFLSKKYDANLIAFESYTLISDKLKKSIFKIFLRNFLIFFSIGTYGVYKSFGVRKFIYPKIRNKDISSNYNIINYYLKKINSRQNLMKMKIKNVYIGDLIYDTYLKVYKLPTIDVSSKNFQVFLKESIILFLWWYDYLKKNKKNIKSIIVIHSVYLYGLQARICNSFNIKAYKPSNKSIIEINSKNLDHTNDAFYNYKNLKKIKNKKIIYNFSKREIFKIIKGKSSVGKNYSSKIKNKFRINISKKTLKILVVCHSFFDAPHSFGKFFKNDFYEWLCLLGEISKKTDYTWLIKPHPITYDEDKIFLEEILNRYPKFKMIEKKYSNQEILNIGIDYALTCFGTISFEYPFLGTKVINFTRNHPFKKFKFSYTPKNLKHYIKILQNLKKFDYSINKKKILEYYFLKRFILDVDYMKLKLDKSKDMEGYRLKKFFFEECFYEQWIDLWTSNKHKEILKNIENFINSREPYMSIYNIKEK